jgi:ATP-binding cassette, subfamily C (CFTR/MRP), member 1
MDYAYDGNSDLVAQFKAQAYLFSQVLGYQRTLQASDLWRMDESREAGVLTAKLDAAWDRRVREAAQWNERLVHGEIHPSLLKRTVWTLKALSSPSSFSERRAELETHWRDVDGRKQASLAWALNDTLGKDFWLGGIFKVIGDTSQTMGPLVVKAIIKFSQKRSQAQEDGTKPPSMGIGVAMAIGVFCITVMASVCQHQVSIYRLSLFWLLRG